MAEKWAKDGPWLKPCSTTVQASVYVIWALLCLLYLRAFALALPSVRLFLPRWPCDLLCFFPLTFLTSSPNQRPLLRPVCQTSGAPPPPAPFPHLCNHCPLGKQRRAASPSVCQCYSISHLPPSPSVHCKCSWAGCALRDKSMNKI